MVVEDGVRRVVVSARYPLYEVRRGDLWYQLETALREVCGTIPDAAQGSRGPQEREPARPVGQDRRPGDRRPAGWAPAREPVSGAGTVALDALRDAVWTARAAEILAADEDIP